MLGYCVITACLATTVHTQYPALSQRGSQPLGGLPDQRGWRTRPSIPWDWGSKASCAVNLHNSKAIGFGESPFLSWALSSLESSPEEANSGPRGSAVVWVPSVPGNQGHEVPRPALLQACPLALGPERQRGLRALDPEEGRGEAAPLLVLGRDGGGDRGQDWIPQIHPPMLLRPLFTRHLACFMPLSQLRGATLHLEKH